MTTPDQPESNPPPPSNLPPPPQNYNQHSYAARSARAARSPQPAAGSSQQPTRRSSKLGTVAMIIGLAFVAWWAYGHFFSGQSPSGQNATDQSFGPSAHRPFPPGNFSSEGDVRSVMQAFTDDWNRSDVTAIRSLWCSGSEPDATILSKQIGWYGHIETSVKDIGRSGDKASAQITVTTSHGGEVEPWFFANEGGSWKPCSVSFIWTQSYGH
jgi:hypothetical protein